jgi:hypothetical protein
MDFQVLEEDLTHALKLLPDQFLKVVATLIIAHKDSLAKVIPDVMEILKSDIASAIMEGSCGILDKKELEATIMCTLQKHGIEMPAELTVVP